VKTTGNERKGEFDPVKTGRQKKSSAGSSSPKEEGGTRGTTGREVREKTEAGGG